MIKQAVLVVEDEADIGELVSYNLLREGYQVACVASGEEALALAESRPFDLVLLDLMLPGVDGLSVCRKVRGDPRTRSVPIVMLTAKGEESDIVKGFRLGADDYITKPFSPRVLIARVQAVLRRAAVEASRDADHQEAPTGIEIHDLAIQPDQYRVFRSGQPVKLSPTEFRVLHLLASRPGRVFTRQQILDALHGDRYAITDRAVDVQIVGLRKRLGSAATYIETVHGVGYRFQE